MAKKNKMLMFASIILWGALVIVAVLQIPLKSVFTIKEHGTDLYSQIMVYQTDSMDSDTFLQHYQDDKIEFIAYSESGYSGSLSSNYFWFLIPTDVLKDHINKGEEKAYIEIGKPQLDYFTTYFLDENSGVLSKKSYGRSLPFGERDYNHRKYYIPLEGIEEASEILFRVKTDSYLQFPVRLLKEKEWVDYLNWDLLVSGLFYGSVFIMFFYNFILGIALKDRNYFYFTAFIVSYLMLQTVWDGFAYQLFWPNSSQWDLLANQVSINLCSLSLLVFTANFLKIFKNRKWFSYSYYGAIGLHLIAMAISGLIPIPIGVYFSMFNAMCTLILCATALLGKGYSSRAEVIYLIGWQFFFGVNTLNIMTGMKIIPYTIVTELSPKVAIIGLIALFSLALSEKLNTIEYLRGIEIEKRRLLKSLHDMHIKISSAKDIRYVFDYLLEMFYSITQYEEGMIVLFVEKKNKLEVFSKEKSEMIYYDIEEHRYNKLFKEISESKSNIFEETKKLEFIKNLKHESVEIISLINIDNPIGFIVLSSMEQVSIDEQTRETINDFAVQIAVTIDNIRLLNNVIYQARHDFLTNAYNRRYFFELATNYVMSSTKEEIIGTIMIDVDDFKMVNDIHGHLVGDEVLIETVKRIKESIDSNSILGRYGGEEFIVLTKSRDKAEIGILAENILRNIRELPVEVDNNQEYVALNITVSIGIAYGDETTESLFSLTDAADTALYNAKNNGKNQISIYS